MVRVATIVAFVFAVAIFVKIAWVNDDAYIMFRSIEQLFAGNGPRWNPHERVQVFTSPLWFGLLSLARVLSPSVFLNAIVLSLILFVATLALLGRVLDNWIIWIVAVFVLVASKGFFDFTSSGLENPLAYLLLVLYLHYYRRFFSEPDAAGRHRTLFGVLASAGAVVLCRHDLSTLILVPTLYACWIARSVFTTARWVRYVLAASAPLVLWSVFAIIYYGTPFPNTAYAKLNTGIPPVDLWAQGMRYLYVTLRNDTITIVVLGAALWVLLSNGLREARALGIGVVMNIAYVVAIGGDFMLGRFLAFSFLIGLGGILLYGGPLVHQSSRWVAVSTVGVAILYSALYPHTPVNTPLGYRAREPHLMGVAHERGAYMRGSLWNYLRAKGPVFPDHHWSVEGYELAHSDRPLAIRLSTGFFGYWAGTEKIIIDRYGLSDPLLARLPIDRRIPWRTGHFIRSIPLGYEESIVSGEDAIVDRDLDEFYKKLKIITQSDKLFAPERLKTILAMNLGLYDLYLPQYRQGK